jgi:hypothetical protein
VLLIFSGAAGQPLQWVSKGVGGGGALFSPGFSPNNPAEMYVASDLAALFHSTDLALTWSVVDFRQIQANRGCNVQFTSDPSILYCLNFKQDARVPYKSADGGSSWNRLASDPTNGEAYSLFVDPVNPRRVVISDFTRVFFSNDGGSSFSLKYQTADQSAGIHLGGAFFDLDNIFVGSSKGLLVSPNGGMNFFLADNGGIPGGESIFSFAGAKQNGIVRLYAVTLLAPSVFAGVLIESESTAYKGIYSLDWGQANWISRGSGIPANHFPSFVAAASSNISTVYVAGGDDREFPVIYKSVNGGAAWQSVLLTSNNQNVFTGWAGTGGDRDWSYGGAALGLAVAPNDPNRVAYTDLGFVHLSTDGGASWRQAYVQSADQNPRGAPIPKGKSYHGNGMENTSCWWLTWSDPSNFFASFTDIRGIRTIDAGNSWSFQYSGHTLNTMYQAIRHPESGVLYAATSSVHDIYQSTYLMDSRIDGAPNRAGRVLFSTDKGATWQVLHDFGFPVIWVAADPNRSNRLYASVIHNGEGGIYVSNDINSGGVSSWRKLANPPRTEGHPFNIVVLNDGNIVATYSGRRAGDPLNFTASSGVFVSGDDGATWSDRSAPGMLYWTKDITINPHDGGQNTWYAAVFSGWGGPSNGLGGLYKTQNRGLIWSRVFASDRVESCTINPKDPNEMYLTTEQQGLWYTGNLTSSFPAFTEVASYPFLHPVRVFYSPVNNNEIWVTSFGNGLRAGGQGVITRLRRRP